MVPFSHCENSRYEVIARRVLVVVRRAAEIVSDGVDAKSALRQRSRFAFDE
jgi:hypothetical protein